MKELWTVINERLQLRSDYIKAFESEEGKRVLIDLMKTAGIPKKQATTDTNSLLIQEGMQIVVYKILRVLRTDPQELMDKIEEQYKESE